MCEPLETRTLLSVTPGYDFVTSGYRWLNPDRIAYSLAPDGVYWDHGRNILNAEFNARFGATGAWQRQVARALATWQSVANLNIVPVADSLLDFNALGSSQGDARFGDIRVGGYVFPGNTTTLAQTYFPPPNGSTAAGDVEVNTAMKFGIGSTYDLYSVLLHEFGHSLGLDHARNPAVVMAANYGGMRNGLTPGDIAGIQAIYGARPLDWLQRQGVGISSASPINVSAGLAASNQTTVSSLSLQGIGSTEYFSLQVPAYASGPLVVTAAARGISMLSPQVRVYDAGGKLLAQAGNASAWGVNASATVASVTPGQRFQIVVSGATGDVFDAGSYQFTASLPGSSPQSPPSSPPATPPGSPPVPTPNPPSPGVIPPDRFEPNNTPASAAWLGRLTQVTVTGLTLTSGADVDVFRFVNRASGSYQVTAAGTFVQVLNARGRFVAAGLGQARIPAARAGTMFYVRIRPPSGGSVAGYQVAIGQTPSRAIRRKAHRPRHLEAGPALNRSVAARAVMRSAEIVAAAAGVGFPERDLAGHHATPIVRTEYAGLVTVHTWARKGRYSAGMGFHPMRKFWFI